MTALVDTATALTRAVDGFDWDPKLVEQCVQTILREVKRAERSDLDRALDVLVERIERFRVDDADGVAHVALTGGPLVEHGATPRRLADVLLRKVPSVLAAAREYVDLCLRDMPEDAADPNDQPETDDFLQLNDVAIPRDIFRRHLSEHRGGGTALARLQEWTLPTVAAITRDREVLSLATNDAAFVASARSLQTSAAYWLHVVASVQIDARWLVLLPVARRDFVSCWMALLTTSNSTRS